LDEETTTVVAPLVFIAGEELAAAGEELAAVTTAPVTEDATEVTVLVAAEVAETTPEEALTTALPGVDPAVLLLPVDVMT